MRWAEVDGMKDTFGILLTMSDGQKNGGNSGLGDKGIPVGSPSAFEQSARVSGQKALIVEDTMELAEVLQITLERMNLTVFHATHGTKALEIYEKEHPDLVLLDLALPDMTGWKVLNAIKDQQCGEKLPVIIVITAYGDPANRLMGKLQSVHSYLIKPFTPDQVQQVVAKALNLPPRKP